MTFSPPKFGIFAGITCILLLTLLIADKSSAARTDTLPVASYDQLLHLKVSTGAAAGYVDDKVCGTCHTDLYQSYQSVGMSHSFTVPKADRFIENFDLPPYYHEKTGRYYQISRNGDDLSFKRWELDDSGKPINVYEHKIDFIIGSGHKTRSYLYREPDGEIFQLPLGWYSEDKSWGMSPGFDNRLHFGVSRQVMRQCLFCHNAFPQVPEGSDQNWQPHTFPATLPQGTGCQRCHGPGAKHVQTVMNGAQSLEQIHQSIVNPAKLPVDKRDSVCFQCHLLPAVDMAGVRKFNRSDYSFRPGEDINDYMYHMDVVDAAVKKDDRFEINHAAYRLRQSRCFTKSAGALTCISCHNPHRKVPPQERAEHYGKVCKSCHQKAHKPKLEPGSDCTACHMPQRRTQDVVRVVMTDHKIQLNNQGKDWLAPLQEVEPILEDVDFLMPEKAPKGDLGQIYKVIAALRLKVMDNYVDYLQHMLAKVKPEDIQPYLDLARGQLLLKRYPDAEKTARWLLDKVPDNFRAQQFLTTSLLGQGRLDEAESLFKPLLKAHGDMAELHFNYALLQNGKGDPKAALSSLDKVIALRPNMTGAWYYKGVINANLKQNGQAIRSFKRSLEIEPSYTRAYLGIAKVLLFQGERDEAIRYLKVGEKSARQKKPVSRLLSQVMAERSGPGE